MLEYKGYVAHVELDPAAGILHGEVLDTEAEVKEFARLLPPSTHWVRIDGGNYAQFAWYGRQLGDQSAKISREEQHRQTVSAVLDVLRRISPAS